ncbi:hypothetical protein J8273_2550 [Carpediemonas membranifera]|uniref:Uncharacterized protein n=1 Tax=Carpediemonas membranifera TaxID=201153 RepID=A0A8J6B5N7_9EUKA|nr:hypothetical protein J8273_2550 [Carpediemonas membranifera]|eukprot:KAG9396198.1 hypothetical protein J8273_2550 [Carpediemonas membranifera]
MRDKHCLTNLCIRGRGGWSQGDERPEGARVAMLKVTRVTAREGTLGVEEILSVLNLQEVDARLVRVARVTDGSASDWPPSKSETSPAASDDLALWLTGARRR